MIEVFKTNVEEASQARRLIAALREQFPGSRINFDLHDCDKILRVEGGSFIPDKIALIVKEKGFKCKALE